jgi:hypothetical protein
MFKLIKLAIYAMIGYAIYEMFQGMKQQQSGGGGGGGSFGRGSTGAFGGTTGGTYGAMTGGGSGTTDTASDMGGAEMRHTVGRGVVG